MSTNLTFTLTNMNAVPLTKLAFTDNLPAGLVVATPNGVSNTCGGTVTATPATGTVSLANAGLPANGFCQIVVSILATGLGPQNNVTSALTAWETVPGNTAAGSVIVTQGVAPHITSANATTFAANQPNSFQVMATGTPPPAFSETGTLPPGVTFSAAGLLSGTPHGHGRFPDFDQGDEWRYSG